MNLDTITSLVVLIGFLLTALLLAQAEMCYREVSRHLAEKGEDSAKEEWIDDRGRPA